MEQIHEIGLVLDLSKGIFTKVVYNEGKLKLAEVKNQMFNNLPVYEEMGTWTSEIIDLVDQYKAFKNIALDSVMTTGESYLIYTRTSSDSLNWEEYKQLQEDGTINSTKNRFIQIKIEIFGNKEEITVLVDNFSAASSINYAPNDLVIFNNGITIKDSLQKEMEPVTGFVDNVDEFELPYLFKVELSVDDFKEITKIEVN